MILERNNALELLHQHVKNPKMIQHSLASEAVMRKLARHFGEDEAIWAQAGLLHDIDVEHTQSDPKIHGITGASWLAEMGLDEGLVDAIGMHNEMATEKVRSTRFQHALAAGETITGLITATTLVYPDKKLASVKTKSVVKRMKEKAFAASVNRDTIMECETIDINIEDFTRIAMEAMLEIHDQLEL